MKPLNKRSALLLAGGVFVPLVMRRTGRFGIGMALSRRRFMEVAGLVTSAVVTGTWWDRSTGLAASPRRTTAATCLLTPEQTEGPYYIAREKVRRNITEHHPGAPLRLRLTVVDAATCRPIQGAAVDIWHCDAGGIYSGFVAASTGAGPGGGGGPTDRNTFLRGIQFTDARGQAEFLTIYPGWYRGRTVHIHVKVHLDHDSVNHVVHTGQLYFQDTLTAKVYQSEPYRSRAAERDTFNNTDGIFAGGGRQSMLSVRSAGHSGYIGSATLGVRRA